MGFLTNLFSVRLQLLQIIYDGALHFVSLYLQLKPLSCFYLLASSSTFFETLLKNLTRSCIFSQM